jgi:hypothetical protein
LNLAARRPDPIYALLILERVAIITVSHKNSSPLARAVVDGHLKTADIIYETRDLISAMRWFHTKGGAHFADDDKHSDPIWSQILTRRPSSSARHVRLDNRMLETLFDMFPDKLSTPDSHGMFHIHWASINWHRGAVELLIERQLDINAETTGGKIPADMVAFTIAVVRIEKKPPADVESGGKVEIRRWRERARDVLEFLISRGATVGQDPSKADLLRSLQYTAHNTSYVATSGRDEDDEIEWKEDI